jgi:5-methyltetrahydropteroyltriglutamate--homocysteine methyltransferase
VQRSTERILTTHAGSLVRPHDILAVMWQRELRPAGADQDLAAILPGAVAEVVRHQVDSGIDVPSDGEFGKDGWIRYVQGRLGGIEPSGRAQSASRFISRMGPEQQRFAGFFDRYRKLEDRAWLPDGLAENMESGASAATTYICTGPITYVGHEALARDVTNMKAALAAAGSREGFLPVAAPASVELYLDGNEHYASAEEFLFAIADALHEEYARITDAGLLVQIDDALLPTHALSFEDPADYRAWAQVRIEALNHALAGIPEEQVRYHLCWGSQNAPHTWDVPLASLIGLILQVRAQGYSIEAASPRHEHEWQLWRDVALPEGKILIPGLVSHSTNVVEHPELVALRIMQYARLVGRENLIAGTDCGFSQSWRLIRVHPEVQWAKLETLAEGARLASRQLWPD